MAFAASGWQALGGPVRLPLRVAKVEVHQSAMLPFLQLAEPAPEETVRRAEPPADTPLKTEDWASESDEYEDY